MSREQDKAERFLNASTRQLVWWRYKKHTLAMIGLISLAGLYFSAAFCEFLAPYSKGTRHVTSIYAPLSSIHVLDTHGNLHRPFVYARNLEVDLNTQQLRYVENKKKRYPIRFLVRGEKYKFWDLWESDVHLFGVEKPAAIYLFGTDRMGRDMFSRCLYGSRISLSIGMVGVSLSLVLGLILGGISGYTGGWPDGIIQRVR